MPHSGGRRPLYVSRVGTKLTLQVLVAPDEVLPVLSSFDIALFDYLSDGVGQADYAKQAARLVIESDGTRERVQGFLALHQLDLDALLVEQKREEHADGAGTDNEDV